MYIVIIPSIRWSVKTHLNLTQRIYNKNRKQNNQPKGYFNTHKHTFIVKSTYVRTCYVLYDFHI